MKIREAVLTFRVVREGDVPSLDCPEAVAQYVRDAFEADPTVEWFLVIPLNARNQPYGRFVVTKGTAKTCTVHPREVLRPVILSNATAFAVAHNHPSSNAQPSQADVAITRTLQQAGETMGIPLIEHVIVGEGFYSFAEAGLLTTKGIP